MAIALIIINLIIIGIGIYLVNKTSSYDYEFIKILIFFIGGIGLIFSILFALEIIAEMQEDKIIDSKIEMYQEENDNIENQISELILNYMSFEKETYSEFKVEDSVTLINLYPELKSEELVQQQLNIYLENNNRIKELKEKKISYRTNKWYLYFGKVKEKGDSNE